MARKQQPAVEAKAPDLPTTSPEEFHQEQQLITRREAELTALDERLGLTVPYNYESFLAYATGLLDGMRKHTLELGRTLMAVREHEGHGQFHKALDRLNLAPRWAYKCISAYEKFCAEGPRKLLADQFSSSKLFELLGEDDDRLDDLANGGSIAGHTLDEIERMSVRELREALRAEKQARAEDRESHEAILQRKDKKLNELASKNRSQGKAPLRKRVEDRIAEINELALAHLSSGDTLRQALLDLNEVVEESGETLDADLDDQIGGHIAAIQTLVTNLAEIAGV